MNATYGTVKPSVINPTTDVEIFYHYRPSRSAEDTQFRRFKAIEDVASILEPSEMDNDSVFGDPVLPGMYKMNLPLSLFGRKGIYTIYIKPREYRATVTDVGVLAAYPGVRGIIIEDSVFTDSGLTVTADSLVGYRIEYFKDGVRQDFQRLITSNNRAEAVTQQIQSAYQNNTGYRYTESGGLHFLTVTPSTSPDFKANATPYIGSPSQVISISNTMFDPVMIEVEMVDHDIETLSIMAEGEQMRNYGNGRITHYNFDGEIYKQYEFATIKDNYTATNIAEIKVDKSGNIDTELNLETLKNT